MNLFTRSPPQVTEPAADRHYHNAPCTRELSRDSKPSFHFVPRLREPGSPYWQDKDHVLKWLAETSNSMSTYHCGICHAEDNRTTAGEGWRCQFCFRNAYPERHSANESLGRCSTRRGRQRHPEPPIALRPSSEVVLPPSRVKLTEMNLLMHDGRVAVADYSPFDVDRDISVDSSRESSDDTFSSSDRSGDESSNTSSSDDSSDESSTESTQRRDIHPAYRASSRVGSSTRPLLAPSSSGS